MDKKIIQSASKLSLLAFVGTLNVITTFSVIWGVVHGSLDVKDVLALFATSTSLVLGFYFGRASAPTSTVDTSSTTTTG